MTATRLLPFLLGGMTLIVLFANALPAARQKHRLQRAQRILIDEYHVGAALHQRLLKEVVALRHDPFYIERTCAETWCVAPDGTIALDVVLRRNLRPQLVRAD